MKKNVVIIDDDQFQMEDYLAAISAAGFYPSILKKVTDVRKIIDDTEHCQPWFFVVDIMMKAEPAYTKKETYGGRRTGLLIARDLRAKFPHVPIVLWSAAHIEGIAKAGKDQAKSLPNCRFTLKSKATPKQLVTLLEHYEKYRRFPRSRIFLAVKGFAKLALKALGIGADIEQLKG